MNQNFPPKNNEPGPNCIVTGDQAEIYPPDEDCVAVRTVDRGESACSSSDPPDAVYYLRSGSIKIVRYSGKGGEVLIDYYKAGTLFGKMCFCDWGMCNEGITREVALAMEDSVIAVMTFAAFKNYVASRPEALLGVLSDYCCRLAAARTRIESFVLHQAEERLAHALLMLASQHSPKKDVVALGPDVTHEELAHLIGISRQFVTKFIGQLRERGLIETPTAGCLIVHRRNIMDAFVSKDI